MYILLGSLVCWMLLVTTGQDKFVSAYSFSTLMTASTTPVFVALMVLLLEGVAGLLALGRRLISKVPRKKNRKFENTYSTIGVVIGLVLGRQDTYHLSKGLLSFGQSTQGYQPILVFLAFVLAYWFAVYGVLNAMSNLKYAFTTPRPAPVPTASTSPEIRRRYTLEELQGMDDRTFERLVAGLFKATGHNVQLTQQTRDGGKDVVAEKDGVLIYIECKRYSPGNPVTEPDIRQFYGTLTADRVQKGVFVTSFDFTRDAETFCHRVGIEPINGMRLLSLLHQQGNVLPL